MGTVAPFTTLSKKEGNSDVHARHLRVGESWGRMNESTAKNKKKLGAEPWTA